MIEIKNLTKRFQDFTALENVTCTIGSGCIYGMVGSNGAGKSTLLITQRIFFYGFEDYDYGLGSALAVFLLLIIAGISLIQLIYLRKREDIYG